MLRSACSDRFRSECRTSVSRTRLASTLSDHRFRVGRFERRDEDAELHQRFSCVVVEEIVTPPDRGGHRLVARFELGGVPVHEAVFEFFRYFVKCPIWRLRRGDLDGEGQFVDQCADLRDDVCP